jgi:hypothetical protein
MVSTTVSPGEANRLDHGFTGRLVMRASSPRDAGIQPASLHAAMRDGRHLTPHRDRIASPSGSTVSFPPTPPVPFLVAGS